MTAFPPGAGKAGEECLTADSNESEAVETLLVKHSSATDAYDVPCRLVTELIRTDALPERAHPERTPCRPIPRGSDVLSEKGPTECLTGL